jgi:hypothetical protein
MKFKRTDEIEEKLFTEALINENTVIKDAIIHIVVGKGSKLKAYCQNTDTFLQFPRDLREVDAIFIADVIEVKNEHVDEKYYRVQKGTIRRKGSNEVVG